MRASLRAHDFCVLRSSLCVPSYPDGIMEGQAMGGDSTVVAQLREYALSELMNKKYIEDCGSFENRMYEKLAFLSLHIISGNNVCFSKYLRTCLVPVMMT